MRLMLIADNDGALAAGGGGDGGDGGGGVCTKILNFAVIRIQELCNREVTIRITTIAKG